MNVDVGVEDLFDVEVSAIAGSVLLTSSDVKVVSF